ncbi:MAG: primosomal protein N', partial [Thiobacillus sp.]|nr:primosomal protein N' [Thiobacillus sp.]
MTPPVPALIQVALDAPLDRLFDYLAPDATEADVGRRVRVPFGRREQVGVIVGLSAKAAVADDQLRAAIAIDRDLPALPADILALARFAAGYYQHPLGPVLLALLPPALKRRSFRAPPPAAYALTEA